jgi:fermentation-respiration switch protein FrsA (DUF1100 family)
MRRFRFLFVAVSLAACLALVGGVFAVEGTLHPYYGSRDRGGRRAYAERTCALTGARFEDVEIAAADGAVLRGWFFRVSPSRGRAVLLLHGQGDNRAGAVGFAPFLLARGYNVLAADSRAHGASGGAVCTYGLLEADDAKRWAEWLKRSHSRVFALGESMGAAILIQALAAGAPIDAAVAESSFSSMREIAWYRIGWMAGGGEALGRTALRPIVETGYLYARLRYGLDLTRVSPAGAVASVRVPVLLIHGGADISIPPEHSRRILANARGRVELWSPPGTGHLGAYARWPEEFERRVAGWFDAVP